MDRRANVEDKEKKGEYDVRQHRSSAVSPTSSETRKERAQVNNTLEFEPKD